MTSGGFNVGDANHDGLIDNGETWQWAITSTAGDTPYSNTVTVSGNYTDAGGNTAPLSGGDSSSYTGVDASITVTKDTLEQNATTLAWKSVAAGDV